MKRLATVAIALALVLGLLAGCGTAATTTAATTKAATTAAGTTAAGTTAAATTKAPAFSGSYTIGVMGPLTGTNAEYGKGFQIATQMAADEINAKGGINGKEIKLVVKDSKGDAKESTDLARQFGDDKNVMAIIGDFSSTSCMAAAPIVDAAGIVLMSPTASNPSYADMSKWAYSVMGRQDIEAPFFSTYVVKTFLKKTKVALIGINSDWGKAAHDNFVKQAKVDGLEIVADVNYVADEKDYTSLISKMRSANPEVVVIMDQGAVVNIANQIAQTGWKVQMAALGPGTSQQIIDLGGANVEGLVTSTPFFFSETNATATAWAAEFKKRAGFQPTVHPACAYDAIGMVFAAMKNSGANVTRDSIRVELDKLDYKGLTGPIKFNQPAGDVSRKYLIAQIENKKFVQKTDFDYVK